MIFTLKKFLIAFGLLVILHIVTGTGVSADFFWIDVFFFIVAYILVLAGEAIYIVVRTKYEYARDKRLAENELLKELDEAEKIGE